MKRRRNQEDEEDTGYQDARDEIESGDAYVITAAGHLGSSYAVNKLSGRFSEVSDAIKAIVRDMRAGQYFPSVYYVNDHGNIDVIAFSKFSDAIKAIVRDMRVGQYFPGVYYVNDHGNVDVIALRIGKRRVTWKTVASYV